MSPTSTAGRALAAQLPAGDHALTNADLRLAYGMSRVTVKARSEVAADLRQAGLQVLSDPRSEPLVVRKRAPQPVAASSPRSARPAPAWWRRPWVIGVAALVLLFLVVGALSGGDPTPPSDAAQAAQGEPTETSEPTASPTPTPAPPTIADANAEIRNDDYARALAIAAVLTHDENRDVTRRIARRLAFRAVKALRANDRRAASALLREARDYPRTPEVARAARALKAAQVRAAARAAAQRRARALAREQRQQRIDARRIARETARREREAAVVAPDVSAPDTSEPSMSGPSTVNWCGKRDGDGDGIYCEGM